MVCMVFASISYQNVKISQLLFLCVCSFSMELNMQG